VSQYILRFLKFITKRERERETIDDNPVSISFLSRSLLDLSSLEYNTRRQ